MGTYCKPVPLAAHPRVSGENALPPNAMFAPPGSSPRERGKLNVGELALLDDGLIPA